MVLTEFTWNHQSGFTAQQWSQVQDVCADLLTKHSGIHAKPGTAGIDVNSDRLGFYADFFQVNRLPADQASLMIRREDAGFRVCLVKPEGEPFIRDLLDGLRSVAPQSFSWREDSAGENGAVKPRVSTAVKQARSFTNDEWFELGKALMERAKFAGRSLPFARIRIGTDSYAFLDQRNAPVSLFDLRHILTLADRGHHDRYPVNNPPEYWESVELDGSVINLFPLSSDQALFFAGVMADAERIAPGAVMQVDPASQCRRTAAELKTLATCRVEWQQAGPMSLHEFDSLSETVNQWLFQRIGDDQPFPWEEMCRTQNRLVCYDEHTEELGRFEICLTNTLETRAFEVPYTHALFVTDLLEIVDRAQPKAFAYRVFNTTGQLISTNTGEETYNPLAAAKQRGQNHSSKPATTIQTTAKMATTQTQGGQNRQQSEAQEPAPEPIDTGLASPLAPGNIFDLGNRFHIPGSPTENEEVYKFVNGRHFNAIEAFSVALAKKTGQDSPRFAFRKGTKDEATGRIDYFGGQVYEAPAQLTEKGFKVVIVQKEGEAQGQRPNQGNQSRGAGQARGSYGGNGNGNGRGGNGNGNGRGSYGGGGGSYGGGQRGSQKEDTGEKTMFGKVVRFGNKFLIGDKELPIYAQVGGHDFTPKEIVAIVDSEGKRKRGERVPAPIIRFPGRDGQPDYDRAVEVNLDSGQIFRKPVPGQDRGDEGQYASQGRGQERGGNNYQSRPAPGPATAADFGGNDDDFDQSQQGGEANDGEGVDGGGVDDDIPDEFQTAAPDPRGRGR